jgi:hypothetical protein
MTGFRKESVGQGKDLDFTDTEEENDDPSTNVVEEVPKKKGKHTSTQAKSKSVDATPSVPSELATTQGRTAYDVRYIFPHPDKV